MVPCPGPCLASFVGWTVLVRQAQWLALRGASTASRGQPSNLEAEQGGYQPKSAKFRLRMLVHQPRDSEASNDPYDVPQQAWLGGDRIKTNAGAEGAVFGALMFLIPFISTAGT